MNALVRRTLERNLSGTYWVRAEISSMQVNQTGHCYLELVQKSESDGMTVAKARANWWRSSFSHQRVEFENATGQRLQSGLKILVEVSVSFHENYGYALVIHDIDPTFTIGDMARRRREIIERLTREGVVDLNRELPMPLVPQRIAVISSASAAGYGDFCNQLAGNAFGLRFDVKLFQAAMQGENAAQSVIYALNCINEEADAYDAVVIIRGGGATSELSCFDSYELALNVANFPLPIITGIGHERDDTVIDMVAHTRVKTPTAAAEFLISAVADFAQRIALLGKRAADASCLALEVQKRRIALISQKIPSLFDMLKLKQNQKMDNLMQRAASGVERYFTTQKHRLEMLEKSCQAASPQLILSRGYSITTLNGKAVRSASALRAGDRLVTRLADGTLESEVCSILKNEEK